MQNLLLFAFDLICLPITLIRLGLIYFNGSRYNINSLQFLDVMIHATNKYFNQSQEVITIDTENSDIRLSLNKASRLNNEIINRINREPLRNSSELTVNLSSVLDEPLDKVQRDKLEHILPGIIKNILSQMNNIHKFSDSELESDNESNISDIIEHHEDINPTQIIPDMEDTSELDILDNALDKTIKEKLKFMNF